MSATLGRPVLIQDAAANHVIAAAEIMQSNVIVDPALVALLKRTMPFGTVSDEVMGRVAALARREVLGPGRMIYHAGDEADDIFIMVSGRVEHTFGPEAGARTR